MEDSNFKDEGIEECLRSINLPLWNALLFFTTYAEVDKVALNDIDFEKYSKNLNENDKYILSELELLIADLTKRLDRYDIDGATREFSVFLDTLNNWYIRRSRPRVWSSDPRAQDKMTFYAVLYRVLERFTKVIAPFCPFLAEAVWEALQGGESVHYQNWPAVEEALVDRKLSDEISGVRRVITAGLAIRSKEKIRVRQPLRQMQLVLEAGQFSLGRYADSIREELNVKEVVELKDAGAIAQRVGRPNAKLLGPRFGGNTQKIIGLVKQGNFQVLPNGNVTVDGNELTPAEVEISYVAKPGLTVEATKGAVVALDTTVTPELALEGDARDLVRQVQELRREAGLSVSDRIRLSVQGADDVLAVHKDYLLTETLSVGIEKDVLKPLVKQEIQLGERSVTVCLEAARA
jgi:isoleucyl-tRNA synthetase